MSDRSDFEGGIAELLDVGRRLLGIDVGFLASDEGARYEVEVAVGDGVPEMDRAVLTEDIQISQLDHAGGFGL